jgi:hypothetical protein
MLPALWSHTAQLCYAPRCMACRDTHLSGKCVTQKQQLKCCSCGGNHTAIMVAVSERDEGSHCKARRMHGEHGQGEGVPTHLPTPKLASSRPSSKQEALSSGYSHTIRGGCTVKAHAFPTPTTTMLGLDRWYEWQAAHMDGPWS